jgi:hypothetical protein
MKLPFLPIIAFAVSSFAGQLSLQLENDFPWHDDADYTHGTRIEYAQENGLRYGIQQQMYTPLDLRNAEQIEGRHPYAGTLLGFVGYKGQKQISDSISFYHDVELAVGVLGPSSHADDVQRFIHKVLGCKDPKGWNHQLHDEFEIELSYWPGIDWRIVGNDYGWSFHWVNEVGGLLGTLQIAGGVNTEFKLGYGFGAAEDDHEIRIRAVQRPVWHVYALAGAEGRVWGRNELLEGNAGYVHNGDTIPVDMETWTGCLKAGFGVRYRQFNAKALWMWWSREYKTQESVPHYMSITAGWEF